MRLIAGALVAFSLGAAPAGAQWSPGQPVGRGQPQTAIAGADGSALVATVAGLIARTAGGTWRTCRGWRPADVVVGPVLTAATAARVGRIRDGRLAVAAARTGSCRVGPWRVVARDVGGARMTRVGRGAAVAWWEEGGARRDRVRLAGRDGRPLTLAVDRVRSVAIAGGARGDLLVAWDARGVVKARFRARSTGRFAPAQRILSDDAFFARLRAAVTPSGRAYLAWTAQFRSEGGDSGPLFAQAAVKPAGRDRFRDAQLLDRAAAPYDAGPMRLVTDGDDGAVAAWTGWDGRHFRVRASTLGPRARFDAAETLSAAGADAVLGDLAGSESGDALAVWDSGPEGPADVRAALRPAGAGFGTEERVGEGRLPRAWFGGPSARPMVVWWADGALLTSARV